MQSYDWPGNVRELQNVVERAVIISESDELHIDQQWLSNRRSWIGVTARPVANPAPSRTLSSQQKDAIEAALIECKGRVAGPFGAAPQTTVNSEQRTVNGRPLSLVWVRTRPLTAYRSLFTRFLER